MKDIVKFIYSVARYVAGLPPHLGKKFYFERYKCSEKLLSELWRYRKEGICPFCKKKKKMVGAFVTHILKVHYQELRMMYEGCIEK